MKVNRHSAILKPSATFAIAARATELQKQGFPVISLSIGQPDFKTPDFICEAAIEAIQSGKHGYTPVGGLAELKEAILQKYQRERALLFQKDEVTCSNGGKQILFNAFSVLLEPGDAVLMADPAWLSYETMIQWAGGQVTWVKTKPEASFRMTLSAIQEAYHEGVTCLLLNSPSNPTGAIIPEEELRAIGEWALEKGLTVISDDVYELFYYTPERPKHILELVPALKESCLIVNAVSKTYAMTGWRLGWAMGPKAWISKMEQLQGQSSSNPCIISQYAALAALTGSQDCVDDMRLAFARRRSILEGYQAKGVSMILPDGAFYAMLALDPFRQSPDQSDLEVCAWLLENKHLAFVPGIEFGTGASGYARMSFACSDAELIEAMERL